MTTTNVTALPDRPAPAPVFGPHYSEADQASVDRILAWMGAEPKRRTRAWLARASGDAPGTVTGILSGKYPSPPAAKLARYLDVIARADERHALALDDAVFVPTSVYQLAVAVCGRARLYRNFGVLSAWVGTGKTTALRRYASETPGTLFLAGDPDMSPRTMLEDLVQLLGIVVPSRGRGGASKSDLFRAVVRGVRGQDVLIILDEAEKCQPSTLEHLRRIRDQGEVGVVLAGTERLAATLRREHGQFDQIRSRVGFWPPVVRQITREDSDALVAATYGGDDGAVDGGVLDACWDLTQGSMRLLAEGLLPAIRDYGTQKGYPLDDRLVLSVGKQALGLTRRGGGQ